MVQDFPLNHCPACQSPTRSPFKQVKGLSLQRCRACTLVYSDPQPRERVATKYLTEYDLAEHFGPLAARKRVLYERRLDHLGDPRRGAERLCDVGCGDGQFLNLARERGWDTAGVELNPPAARRAAEGGATIFEGALEETTDLPWETFDLVTAWDSLEHTPTPADFMSACARLVRPGGRLALTTLNLRSLVAMAFGKRWSLYVEDHFTYWNEKSLVVAAVGSGLIVESTFHAGLGRDFVQSLDWLNRLRRGPDREGASSANGDGPAAPSGWDSSKLVVGAESVLNRSLDRFALGVEVGIVARKPPLGET